MAKHVFLPLIVLVLMLLPSSMVVAQPSVGDLLLYYDRESDHPGVTAYNPATGAKLRLPAVTGIRDIRTSGDGRIGYIQDNDVWVLDVLNAPNSPVNITQTPDEPEARLEWVADGSLLQFQTGSDPGPYILYLYDGREVLAVDYGYHLERYWNDHGWYVWLDDENADGLRGYVWDGQARIDFALPPLPTEPVWHAVEWTPHNDHLFITVGYQEPEYYGARLGPTDIFYWNGHAVREVENPSGDGNFMLGDWHTDGQLILYTRQDYVQWYVWDGVSFTPEGIPDTAALTAINGPNDIIGDIQWMPDGRLVLVTHVDPESHSLLGQTFACSEPCWSQVFLWDGQTLQLVTHSHLRFWISVHANGSMAVHETNGLVTWSVAVFDHNLQPVFQSGGPYSASRWSTDGDLASCAGRSLSVWNGQDSTLLSSVTYSLWLMAPSWPMLCSVG